MGNFQRLELLGVGLWLATATAVAQYRGPDRYDSDRGGAFRRGYPGAPGLRGEARGAAAVDRTLSDLSRVQSYGFAGRRGSGEFEKARRDLLRFRDDWMRGRFDRGRLDNAIGHVRRAAREGRLNPGDRQLLERDAYALQEVMESRVYSPRY